VTLQCQSYFQYSSCPLQQFVHLTTCPPSQISGQTVCPHVPFVTKHEICLDKQFSHTHLKHFVDKKGGQTVHPHSFETLRRQKGWTNSSPTLVCPNTLSTSQVDKQFIHSHLSKHLVDKMGGNTIWPGWTDNLDRVNIQFPQGGHTICPKRKYTGQNKEIALSLEQHKYRPICNCIIVEMYNQDMCQQGVI